MKTRVLTALLAFLCAIACSCEKADSISSINEGRTETTASEKIDNDSGENMTVTSAPTFTGNYTAEEKLFYRDGKKIYGKLYLPEGSGSFPTVMIAHGFGGNLTYNEGYAENFAKNGIAAYIFDFIGGGYGIRSDGSMTEMSVLTEATDMNTVFDGIAELPEIDKSNMFVMGESQGGFVASYIAASRPDDVRGLVAVYPAYVIHDDAWQRTPDPDNIPDRLTVMGMTIGGIYNRDAMSFDIYDMMPDYKRKVLIIHGTADGIVPISYSERAVETFPSAELVKIDGAGHGFYGNDADHAAELALKFVKHNCF